MTTNVQLLEIVNSLGIPNFKGVFCKDQLADAGESECGIINLDNSDGPGTHWTAYYRKDGANFYFSSFGDDPPIEVVEYLGKPILTHNFCIQEFHETNCGEFSVLFLYLMSKGHRYEDVVLLMVSS
jgi:hypothetical protein